jgi:non-ribosomal peptide synthetase component F
MAAILKAGGAYVPLSPEHPISRRQQLIVKMDAHILLTSPASIGVCKGIGVPIMVVSRDLLEVLERRKPSPVKRSVGPNNAAYVLFTSGTTGTPKGVIGEHSALATGCLRVGSRLGLTLHSRMLQFSNYIYDVSISEIFSTLLCGAAICIPSEAERVNAMEAFINRSQATIAMLTPSFASTISPAKVPTLQAVILGGEAPTLASIETWASQVRLMDNYGPAEAGISTSQHMLSPGSRSATNVGSGFNNRL